MRRARFLLAGLVFFVSSSSASGGVFFGTVDCRVPLSENFCAQGMTLELNGEDEEAVNPFGVVHPLGFDGTPGMNVINIPICVARDSSDLIGPTQRAIAIWNDLTPSTGQCRRCFVVEEAGETPDAPLPFHAETVILHELGHCAMGLDHPNLQYDPPGEPNARESTSFTMSYNGSSIGIDDGPDDIRGSLDDKQMAGGGQLPDSVHWFRRSDNNPAVVDGTMIDIATYSRSTSNLPSRHSSRVRKDTAEAVPSRGALPPAPASRPRAPFSLGL